MAHELHGILYSNVHPVSGGPYQIAPRDEESFLKDVITPIYNVMRKVTVVLFHCITLCLLLTIHLVCVYIYIYLFICLFFGEKGS